MAQKTLLMHISFSVRIEKLLEFRKYNPCCIERKTMSIQQKQGRKNLSLLFSYTQVPHTLSKIRC